MIKLVICHSRSLPPFCWVLTSPGSLCTGGILSWRPKSKAEYPKTWSNVLNPSFQDPNGGPEVQILDSETQIMAFELQDPDSGLHQGPSLNQRCVKKEIKHFM